ncbi:MAG: exodeoxyribonuclease VII large subunit, partial [Spirochaetota bacterium]
VYEKRGAYQMIAAVVKLEGIGELQKRIEQLKKKLSAEGLFDQSRKKEIPFLPRRIGVVTSPTGAAFRDILKVALRRYPTIEIILAPAKVQGDDAAATIVKGIEELNNPKWGIDLIIAGRGGGSFEDLMPFNEECVVRAFADSRLPIISAVGHQIDHPLSDDAADIFAPTPSAAAELAVPVKSDLFAEIDNLCEKMERSLDAQILRDRAKLESLISRRVMSDPGQMIYMKQIELSELKNRMSFSLRDTAAAMRNRYASLPDISRTMASYLERKKNLLSQGASSLEQLSPLGVIARGYALPFDAKETLIRSVKQVSPGEKIKLYIHDGTIRCTADSVEKGASFGKES